jgi:hypothetical protein
LFLNILAMMDAANPPPRPASLALHPFAVLRVGPRASADEIAAAAVACGEPILADEARALLLDPVRRIEAEISWFPGTESAIGPLARANLFAERLRDPPAATRLEIVHAHVQLIAAAEQVATEAVIHDLNMDRAAAGFPPVDDPVALEAALHRQRDRWTEASAWQLRQINGEQELLAVFDIVAKAWEFAGTRVLPRFMDAYYPQLDAVRETWAQQARARIAGIEAMAAHGTGDIEQEIQALAETLKRTIGTTRAIERRFLNRERADPIGEALGWAVRDLALALHNRHGLSAPALELIQLVARRCAAMPELEARLAGDVKALNARVAESRLSS